MVRIQDYFTRIDINIPYIRTPIHFNPINIFEWGLKKNCRSITNKSHGHLNILYDV